MSLSAKQNCLAWWQLLRIGNVFTAASNVVAGFLIVQGGWDPVEPLMLLIATSALLYTAGMVLNDAFDVKLDTAERPERPIPSGRISRGTAYLVGWILLTLGILCGWSVSWLTGMAQPGVVATLLALTVIGYDAGLKNTPLGPWTMGGCRLLNVLLGASVATQPKVLPILVYGILVTIYTIGLTYFARSENEDRITSDHRIGQCFIGAAIGGLTALLILLFPGHYDGDSGTMFKEGYHFERYFCWIALAAYICWSANVRGSKFVTRNSVTRLIQGFILIDAFVAFGAAGIGEAVIVLALLIPTWIASRFAPMT
jgi:hypothetical protein